MRFDRRDFIRIGSAGALGALSQIGCGSQRTDLPGVQRDPAEPKGLTIRFRGLCLLERQPGAMIVHLVDAASVGLSRHNRQMLIQVDAIDERTDTRSARRIDLRGKRYWMWDLSETKITVSKAAEATSGVLTVEEGTIPDAGPIPTPDDDEGWKSLHWVPNLGTLCGATGVVKPAASTITLTHGRFRSKRPDDDWAAHAIWKCSPYRETKELRRAFTDQVVYDFPTPEDQVAMSIGSNPIVFKRGTGGIIEVENLPPAPRDAESAKEHPNMHHFEKFYDLVNAKARPRLTYAGQFPPEGLPQSIRPDYCPAGLISTSGTTTA